MLSIFHCFASCRFHTLSLPFLLSFFSALSLISFRLFAIDISFLSFSIFFHFFDDMIFLSILASPFIISLLGSIFRYLFSSFAFDMFSLYAALLHLLLSPLARRCFLPPPQLISFFRRRRGVYAAALSAYFSFASFLFFAAAFFWCRDPPSLFIFFHADRLPSRRRAIFDALLWLLHCCLSRWLLLMISSPIFFRLRLPPSATDFHFHFRPARRRFSPLASFSLFSLSLLYIDYCFIRRRWYFISLALRLFHFIPPLIFSPLFHFHFIFAFHSLFFHAFRFSFSQPTLFLRYFLFAMITFAFFIFFDWY